MKKNDLYPRIYAVVKRIPQGRVATYGQVASLAGFSGHARLIGYALSALSPENDAPWHRVINAKGRVSTQSEPGWENYQRSLLETEGVLFEADERVSLDRFGWSPEDLKRGCVSEVERIDPKEKK
ncbi:MAG: MGMT family protein [Candidatus Latescibacteria bacterium]|nr:MGMT family protein [Candidatus Latescibacterota bacterium]